MRYSVSGTATGTPDSTSSLNLLGRAVPATRVFWLKKVWAYKDTLPADSVALYDASSSTTGAPASTLLRYRLLSQYGVVNDEAEFPGKGLKFESGCVAVVDGTATGYTLLGGQGYEE